MGDNHMQEQGLSSASCEWLPLKGYVHTATGDQAQGQPHDQGGLATGLDRWLRDSQDKVKKVVASEERRSCVKQTGDCLRGGGAVCQRSCTWNPRTTGLGDFSLFQ